MKALVLICLLLFLDSTKANLRKVNLQNKEELVCSRQRVYNSSTIIKSPGYPNNYPNDLVCTWIFNAEENDILTFDFQQFNVEPGKDCKHDYVKIYNKYVSEKFCGVKNGVAKLRKKFTTKGKTSLVFISDDTVSMSGFVIDVKIEPNESEKLLSRSVSNDTENTEAEITTKQTTIEDTTQEELLEITTFAQETLDDTSEGALEQTSSLDNVESTTALKTKEIKKETKQDLDISDSMKSRYGCSDMLCNNNGRCYKFYGGFVCFCQNGFTGKYCDMTLTTSTLKTTTTEEPTTKISETTVKSFETSTTADATMKNEVIKNKVLKYMFAPRKDNKDDDSKPNMTSQKANMVAAGIIASVIMSALAYLVYQFAK